MDYVKNHTWCPTLGSDPEPLESVLKPKSTMQERIVFCSGEEYSSVAESMTD